MRGKKIVIFSFVIATLIFIAGVALGISIDQFKADTVSTELRDNELKFDSYITEQQLLSAFKEDKCDVLKERATEISQSTRELGTLLNRVAASKSFPMDFDYLKQKYFISESKFYATILELNEGCNDKRNSILFFYKEYHLTSQRQGFVLDEINKQFNETVTTLSFDMDYEKEPLVGLLIKRYNVTRAPTVIINEDLKIEGYDNLEEIETYLYPQNN